MSWNLNQYAKPMKALSSMAGMQYRIVELATSEPNACDYAAGLGGYGILANEPLAGEFATVVVDGEFHCRAGKSISIGDWITTATSAAGGSGWATNVVSGSSALGLMVIGRALSAAASGSLFTLDVDPDRIFGVSSANLVTT